MITRNEAKNQISSIILNSKPVKTGIKTALSKTKPYDVYRIPIKLLVPNIYNDRIAGRIREFEELKKRELKFSNQSDVEIVFDFIDQEHPIENKTTFEDIKNNGQKEHGVITNDGIVLDGNRRLMLLRKICNLSISELKKLNINKEEFEYFDAIVYPEDLDKKGIIEKETILQIAQEGPIKYNRINLYIKIDNMFRLGIDYEDIATYMGHGYEENEIKKMHETFELMNQYLISINKNNQFTLLDGLEDQFINSKNAFSRISKKNNKWYSEKPNFLADFKKVTFQLLRAKVEGKNFRKNFLGTNDNTGVLVSEQAWQKFKNTHEEIINESKPAYEADWHVLSQKFTGNINRIVSYAGGDIGEVSVESIIGLLEKKTNELKNLLEKTEFLNHDKNLKLKNIEKTIRNLRESYGDNS